MSSPGCGVSNSSMQRNLHPLPYEHEGSHAGKDSKAQKPSFQKSSQASDLPGHRAKPICLSSDNACTASFGNCQIRGKSTFSVRTILVERGDCLSRTMNRSIGKALRRWYSAVDGVGFGTTSKFVLAPAHWPGGLPLAAGAPSRKVTLPVFDSPRLPAVPALPRHLGQRRPARNAAGNGGVKPQQAGAEASCQTGAGTGFLRPAGTAHPSARGIAL